MVYHGTRALWFDQFDLKMEGTGVVNSRSQRYGGIWFTPTQIKSAIETHPYRKPWFHGFEHLTINSQGYVSWKGQVVEHYSLRWAYSDKAQQEARELVRRCHLLEARGIPPAMTTVIWSWNETVSDCPSPKI